MMSYNICSIPVSPANTSTNHAPHLCNERQRVRDINGAIVVHAQFVCVAHCPAGVHYQAGGQQQRVGGTQRCIQ
jgi:hypothetical protein